MASETSSAAAATTPVVGAAAAALAALIFEPILAKSVAAASTIAGAALTNDMLPPLHQLITVTQFTTDTANQFTTDSATEFTTDTVSSRQTLSVTRDKCPTRSSSKHPRRSNRIAITDFFTLAFSHFSDRFSLPPSWPHLPAARAVHRWGLLGERVGRPERRDRQPRAGQQ